MTSESANVCAYKRPRTSWMSLRFLMLPMETNIGRRGTLRFINTAQRDKTTPGEGPEGCIGIAWDGHVRCLSMGEASRGGTGSRLCSVLISIESLTSGDQEVFECYLSDISARTPAAVGLRLEGAENPVVKTLFREYSQIFTNTSGSLSVIGLLRKSGRGYTKQPIKIDHAELQPNTTMGGALLDVQSAPYPSHTRCSPGLSGSVEELKPTCAQQIFTPTTKPSIEIFYRFGQTPLSSANSSTIAAAEPAPVLSSLWHRYGDPDGSEAVELIHALPVCQHMRSRQDILTIGEAVYPHLMPVECDWRQTPLVLRTAASVPLFGDGIVNDPMTSRAGSPCEYD